MTNKIAAGEVVERPASVVKELVENSIDAGCKQIIIEIEAGGKKSIRVSDDGCGMSRDDALLALERHATSKIAGDDDLFRLSTLGFRGEALPSIASVSRFTLATREENRIEGTEIYIEGGRIKDVKACGMPVGTIMTVRNLFFNTPARLKFMKSNETEAGHVGELLTRLAMSRPDIRFTYINDGKTVFLAAQGDLVARVAGLLGNKLMSSLFPVEGSSGTVAVRGFVAGPDCSRSSSSALFTYINGRYIRDRVVQHAILQGYRNSLERGRFPVAVLFVDVPPEEVDVNVHPTKHEVRFRDQGRVHDVIRSSIESVLRNTPWIKKPSVADATFTVIAKPENSAAARVAEVRESLAAYQPILPRSRNVAPGHLTSIPPSFAQEEAPAQCNDSGYYSQLTVIGQFNAAYILCQDSCELLIIDQHAAHERVAYERLKKEFDEGAIEAQGMLFPQTMELSLRESAALREYRGEFERLGLELENFGGTTWVLKAVPRVILRADYSRIIRDILEELLSVGKSGTFADCREKVLATIACHSVVRGAQSLSLPEIKALFIQMDQTDFSGHCPHGRPVLRKISLAEIERMFKRT